MSLMIMFAIFKKVTVKLREASVQMENQANLVLEQIGMGRAVEMISFGAMKSALKVLHKIEQLPDVKILEDNE